MTIAELVVLSGFVLRHRRLLRSSDDTGPKLVLAVNASNRRSIGANIHDTKAKH